MVPLGRGTVICSLATLLGAAAACSIDAAASAEAVGVPEPTPAPASASSTEPDPSTSAEPPLGPAEPAAPTRAAQLELTFVGDVVLGRYLANERFAELYPPGEDPFFAVREQLAADVVVGNLESPAMFVLPERSPSRHRNRFAAAAGHVEQLAAAGFTVMSLANNHYFDLGLAGQLESPRVLAEAGIQAVGASRAEAPLIRLETHERDGWRIGFIAVATRQNSTGDPDGPRLPLLSLQSIDDYVVPLVAAARADHDVIVVAVHWGDEYVDDPGRSRRIAAHRMLDAGVDLVIGHHPHVLQAIERSASGDERDGLIAYSLGNFLFPRGDHPPGLSGILRVRYEDLGAGVRPCLAEARVHPVVVARKPRWHPEAAEGLGAEKVRRRIEALSRDVQTRWRRTSDEHGAASEDLRLDGLRQCPDRSTQADAPGPGPA